MRAALTTIEVMEDDQLARNAGRLGTKLHDAFVSELREVDGFVEMRGKGLMMGIMLDRPCGPLVQQALEAGLVINVTADTVVRLLPPLIFTDAHADQLVTTLVPLIRNFLSSRPRA